MGYQPVGKSLQGAPYILMRTAKGEQLEGQNVDPGNSENLQSQANHVICSHVFSEWNLGGMRRRAAEEIFV